MPKTYNDLYLDGRRQLKQAGVEAAALESRELLCYASGKDRDSFYQDSRLQGRFRHCFKPGNEWTIEAAQQYVDQQWEALLAKCK